MKLKIKTDEINFELEDDDIIARDSQRNVYITLLDFTKQVITEVVNKTKELKKINNE